MATYAFTLPDLGEGVTEGEIVKWLVAAGEVVAEDTGIVEVMTDKATVTIPTARAGKVLRTIGEVGSIAKVHSVLMELEVSASDPSDDSAPPVTERVAPSASREGAPQVAPRADIGNRIAATPLTRRMAREHGVDLAGVQGTGPQGRVLKADLEAVLHGGNGAKAPQLPGEARADERIPLRGLRKRIAEKMVRSKTQIPHFAFVEEVDASALLGLRDLLNEQIGGGTEKISFLPFLVKAVTSAFHRFPQINAIFDDAADALVVRGEVNVGVAVMTPEGLTVPVVRNAQALSLRALSLEIGRLAAAARNRQLKSSELSGGTFTVSSLGANGGLLATPIINHPEVAIMGVHRLAKRPIVDGNDNIVVRPMMNLSFCFDHRVIDGAVGADFAYEVIKFVARPERMLLDFGATLG